MTKVYTVEVQTYEHVEVIASSAQEALSQAMNQSTLRGGVMEAKILDSLTYVKPKESKLRRGVGSY